MTCQKDLMAAGLPYPRTCQRCGLGHCTKYPDHKRKDWLQFKAPEEEAVNGLRICRRKRFNGDPEAAYFQIDFISLDGRRHSAVGATPGEALMELGLYLMRNKVTAI